MKTHIISTIFIFIAIFANAQIFSKDYFEYCSSAWEKQPIDLEKKSVDPFLDSMVFSSTGRHTWEVDIQKEKQSALENILHYLNIFKLKGLNADSIKNFILIEETNLGSDWSQLSIKEGIVVLNEIYFSYKFDLSDSTSLKLTGNFLQKWDLVDKKNPRSILFHLAKNNSIDKINELAIQEMKSSDPNYEFKKQFEILVYDSKALEKIKLIYLHELLVNQ